MSVNEELRLLRQAVREAILYLEAPASSPRTWPVSRANLYQLLKRAYNSQRKPSPSADGD